MSEWGFVEWLKFAGVWAAVFAVVGGIITQTSGGISGRGFMEGMWKGIEWFFLAAVGVVVIWGIFQIMGVATTSINQ